MLDHYEQHLRTSTNRNERPYALGTISGYMRAARHLVTWLDDQNAPGDLTAACNPKTFNPFLRWYPEGHSQNGTYRRRLQDMSYAGRAVLIVLQVRRFICVSKVCPVSTFVEQVPDLTERHQQRTPVLHAMLQRIALALAGRAGARLPAVLGIAVSRSTLIRLIRALPDPPIGAVRVLGMDDFALRRGHIYGTILLPQAPPQIDQGPCRARAGVAAIRREGLVHHASILQSLHRRRAGRRSSASWGGHPPLVSRAQ